MEKGFTKNIFIHLKGGIISDSFSRWLQTPIKCAKKYPDRVLFRWIVIKHFYGRLEPKQKNSEIMPPLVNYQLQHKKVPLTFSNFEMYMLSRILTIENKNLIGTVV